MTDYETPAVREMVEALQSLGFSSPHEYADLYFRVTADLETREEIENTVRALLSEEFVTDYEQEHVIAAEGRDHEAIADTLRAAITEKYVTEEIELQAQAVRLLTDIIWKA